jgi:hypothetical protein
MLKPSLIGIAVSGSILVSSLISPHSFAAQSEIPGDPPAGEIRSDGPEPIAPCAPVTSETEVLFKGEDALVDSERILLGAIPGRGTYGHLSVVNQRPPQTRARILGPLNETLFRGHGTYYSTQIILSLSPRQTRPEASGSIRLSPAAVSEILSRCSRETQPEMAPYCNIQEPRKVCISGLSLNAGYLQNGLVYGSFYFYLNGTQSGLELSM